MTEAPVGAFGSGGQGLCQIVVSLVAVEPLREGDAVTHPSRLL
jgi:hypothetical protein